LYSLSSNFTTFVEHLAPILQRDLSTPSSHRTQERYLPSLLNSALKFTVKEISENGQQLDRLPCFEIKQEVLAQLSGIVQIEPSKTGYSAFEIDDLLLGHFDDLGWYVKRGLIDYGTALQSFRYYLVGSFDSPPIQQYIQDEDNEGMYENVRYLYNKFTASPPPPNATASRWWPLRW
jgi:hypothetical protein